MPERTPSSPGPKHVSTRAAHPDVREVLPRFVHRLPAQVERLRRYYAAGDTQALGGVLHQLKGAGASYGFTPVSDYAETLGELLAQGRPLTEAQPLLERLIAYLEQIEGYRGAGAQR